MKNIITSVLSAAIILAYSCGGNTASEKKPEVKTDSTIVPDTGYTGIKKYYSNDLLIKEVTFKNGVRQGEMKSYYKGGQLYQTFWYENGLREDSAKWYYLEGQVFRSTPFKNDTADGIQKQYYRNGRLKAKIKYVKGKRTPFLEEYTKEGKLIKEYPEIVYKITDNYKSAGKVRINLDMSKKSSKIKFFRGEFTNGVFDTTRCTRIQPSGNQTYIDLKKTGSQQASYVGIIGVYLTELGNNYLTYKKIELPYNDLK